MSRASRVAALATLAALGACTPGPAGRFSAAGERPVRGGSLRVLLAEDVDSLDPHRAVQPPAWMLARALHRGLMAFPAAPPPAGARPVPDLAAAPPEVSPDGLRYVFRLREGAAFGPPASRPIRAADVKASLERALAMRSPVAPYLEAILGAGDVAAGRASGLAGVEAPDDRTVVIRLARPTNDLLWVLALPGASVVPAGTPPALPPAGIAGAGPYRLAEGDGYLPERRIHLVRNPAWRASADPVRAAHLDEVLVEVGVPPAEAARRIVAGEADLSGDAAPPQGLGESATPGMGAAPAPAPAPAPGPRLELVPNGCLRYLFLNVRVPPFDRQEVRAAVARAVDRGAVAAAAGPGATPAATILPPTVDGHDPSRRPPGPDPAGARAALVAAGLPGGVATRLVVGDSPADLAQADVLRRSLAAAGVRVAVEPVPVALLYEDRYEVAAARVPMGLATWCADWPGLGGRGMLAPLVGSAGVAPRGATNYAGLASPPDLDRALAAAETEPDPAVAAARWREADAAAVALAAVVPIAHLAEPSLLGPRVRGWVAHPAFVRGDLTALWLAGP